MKHILRSIVSAALIFFVAFVASTHPALAASTSNVTQVISGGALAVDIRDASRNPVASPTFGLGALTFSFNCQTSTGTIGSNTQRIYVDNPGAASNGWTVTVAATGGATSTWSNAGATRSFDYNDPTTAGCADGPDADTAAGQMSLDASAATLTTDCASCSTSNITQGAATAFSQGTTNTITLLNASASASSSGRWYLTGIGVAQTLPAEQQVDNYSINLTATVTAS